MVFLRAFAVWLVIIFAESVHGIFRQLFLAPVVGDFQARRIGVFVGMILIFVFAFLFVRWIAARTTKSLFAVGLLWMILTAAFEIALGRFLGFSPERIFEDYDISHAGLIAFGLVFMTFAPWLVAKLKRIQTAGTGICSLCQKSKI